MKYLIFISCILFPLAIGAVSPGFLEGHLTIISNKEVDLADQTQPVSSNYDDYPLIVMAGKKQIATITADKKGNYRVELAPGKYVLDAEGRTHGHLRVKPQPFTIVSEKTVRVNMEIDTGVR